MESRSAVLGSHSKRHRNYGKIRHENGLKEILKEIFKCR